MFHSDSRSSKALGLMMSGSKCIKLSLQSIITFVNMMNHRLRVPLFNSPVDSEQATDPAGYSPPIPYYTRSALNLNLGGSRCLAFKPLSQCRTSFNSFESRRDEKAYHSNEETPGSKCCKHALNAPFITIRARSEGGKDSQANGRNKKTVLARPFITCVTKDQHAGYSACEGDRGDISLCW